MLLRLPLKAQTIAQAFTETMDEQKVAKMVRDEITRIEQQTQQQIWQPGQGGHKR